MTNVQYSGQGRERLIQAVAATADANGLIAFRLGPCPLGFVWQGSVTVTNAPSGALFNASVASTPWGQWAGPTNFGPVQLWGNETLTVAGVGLQKLTQYSMLFVGVALPEQKADPLPPVAPSSVVTVETTTPLILARSCNAGTTTFGVTPPTLTRRMTMIIDDSLGTALVTVTGVTTGQEYFGVFADGTQLDTSPLFFAIEPSLDVSYTVSVTVVGGPVRFWLLASSTNPLFEPNGPLEITQPVLVNINEPTPAVPGSPVNTSGSPVRPFNHGFEVPIVGEAAPNSILIAAPGVGQSIYVQTLGAQQSTGTAPTFAQFNSTVLGNFAVIIIPNNQFSQAISYPGGLEIGDNAALRANVGAGSLDTFGTYTIGPAL